MLPAICVQSCSFPAPNLSLAVYQSTVWNDFNETLLRGI